MIDRNIHTTAKHPEQIKTLWGKSISRSDLDDIVRKEDVIKEEPKSYIETVEEKMAQEIAEQINKALLDGLIKKMKLNNGNTLGKYNIKK